MSDWALTLVQETLREVVLDQISWNAINEIAEMVKSAYGDGLKIGRDECEGNFIALVGFIDNLIEETEESAKYAKAYKTGRMETLELIAEHIRIEYLGMPKTVKE